MGRALAPLSRGGLCSRSARPLTPAPGVDILFVAIWR